MAWVRDRRTDFVKWKKSVRASVQRGCKGEAISYLPCGNKHHQEPIQELSIIFPSWIGLLSLVLLSRVVLHPKQSADVNEVGFLTSGRPTVIKDSSLTLDCLKKHFVNEALLVRQYGRGQVGLQPAVSLNFIVCELEKIGVHRYHFTKRWTTSSRALSAQTGEQDGG